MARKLFSLVIILILAACSSVNKTPVQSKAEDYKLLVELDAGDLVKGEVTVWTNKGSLGGDLKSSFCGGAKVEEVHRRKAVTFNGRTDYLKSDFTAPESITANSAWTVAVWACNPEIGAEECMIHWARRGTSPRAAQINYGNSRDYGAVTHWSSPDMGYDGGLPSAGKWHHIVVTYEGGKDGLETVYVDGEVNATEKKTLNLWTGDTIYIGNANGEKFFSGALSSVEFYDYCLSKEEVSFLAGKEGEQPKQAVVDLKADKLSVGELKEWSNLGQLGGKFGMESTAPLAETVAGKAAVTFGKNKWLKSTFKLGKSLADNGNFTLMALVYKPEVTNNTETMVSIVSPDSGRPKRFDYGNTRRKVAFASGRDIVSYEKKIPEAKQWHYIAYAYSENEDDLKIYVDGNLQGGGKLNLDFAESDIMCLGSSWDNRRQAGVNPFAGSIAKLQLYDKALPQIQIRALAGIYKTFNPLPADGVIFEGLKATLYWQQGTTDAKSYKIYFSKDREKVSTKIEEALASTQSAKNTDFGPVDVTLGQTYYWRVDQVNKEGVVQWAGDVWQFTVETGQAENSLPENKITGVDVDRKKLRWQPGEYATSQNLYFGTTLEEVNEAVEPTVKEIGPEVSEIKIPVESLEYGQRYYWRVDEINGDLPTSRGEVWSFRTDDEYVYNDITFFVCSDTHYGASDTVRKANQATIDNMNQLAGTKYPESVRDGIVKTPRGVLVCGDLTNDGKMEQWAQCVEDFGLTGKEGRLKFPVYEGAGNHDGGPLGTGAVRDRIVERNERRPELTKISDNGLHYSWDWDDVHFVCLNHYAGTDKDPNAMGGDWNEPENSLPFLIEDLAENVNNSGRPVVLYQHYGFDEGFSFGWQWWTKKDAENLYEAIKDYNVVAIFWGHTHAVNFETWKGISVYNDGATQRDPDVGDFLVVHIKDNEMVVVHRLNDRWGISQKKTITARSSKKQEKQSEQKVTVGAGN